MGSGSLRLAPATGPAGHRCGKQVFFGEWGVGSGEWRNPIRHSLFAIRRSALCADMDHESDQADRAISTGKLNASPRLHTRPIDVVVFHGSDREYSFQGGFPA